MSFHEIQFPPTLSFGSSGGPERKTEIVTLYNGHEERNTPWAHSRHRYDAGMGMRSMEDVEHVIEFFEARRGQLHGFRWKDWADFRSTSKPREIRHDDQLIAIGDGVQSVFQIIKTYESGEGKYQRPITKPVDGTVLVAIGDVVQIETIDFTVDHTTGEITFSHPPEEFAEITAGYEFDVPVRFDTDQIVTSIANYQAGQVPSIPVIEVRS